MRIGKQVLRDLIEDLPEEVEIDELLYRVYLRVKLEEAEEDLRAGRVFSHKEVEAETARWFGEDKRVEGGWRKEIERRIVGLDEGVVEPVSWEEVKARIFGRP